MRDASGAECVVPMPQFTSRDDEPAARIEARKLAVLAQTMRNASEAPTEAETMAEYAKRWFAHRASKGRRIESDESKFRVWIAPVFGTMPMRSITKRDCEQFVQALDERIHSKGDMRLNAITACLIFGVLRRLLDDATNSKNLGLRVLETNPCLGVRKPDTAHATAKGFIYPSEFLLLANCADVSLRLRRNVALALYLGLRPGELSVLRWSDVDEARGVVHVVRAQNRRTGEISTPKNGKSRDVPIEKTLLPLLEIMRAECDGEDLVARLDDEASYSRNFRSALKKAGCTREALFVSTETTSHIRGYDLRGSCATWCAVRGDRPYEIKERLGHADLQTTDKYVRRVQSQKATFGEVFPALPLCLLGVSKDDASPVEQSFDDGVLGTQLGTERTKERKNTSFMVFQPFTNDVLTRSDTSQPTSVRASETTEHHVSQRPNGTLAELHAENEGSRADAVARLSRLITSAATAGNFSTVQALVATLETLLRGSCASPAPSVNVPSVLLPKLP